MIAEREPDELDAQSAPRWLAARGFELSDPRCTELGGGVSNRVILVEAPAFRTVVKQSLGRLRVEREWLSDRSRIFREADAMRWLAQNWPARTVRAGRVPKVLCEDRAGYAIAMEAAPAGAAMWKTRLLAGEADGSHAGTAGAMLGSIVSASWNHPEARRLFGDRTVFEQLRIEPYYHFTAARHPALKGHFDRLIERSLARRVSLVHGDWSPKNLLVGAGPMWAIDWEVAHFGDPSFDAAFLLNHLLLKSIAMPRMRPRLAELALEFNRTLALALPPEAAWVESAALEHLPALLLARVDGKSPAEYLDDAARDRARQLAISLMTNPATSIEEAFVR